MSLQSEGAGESAGKVIRSACGQGGACMHQHTHSSDASGHAASLARMGWL